MGLCSSVEERDKEKANAKIEADIKSARLERNIKMLLLGSGESGKSTVLNQMKILHDGGFNSQEIEHRKTTIFVNIVRNMADMLLAMQNLDIELDSPEKECYARLVLETRQSGQLIDSLTHELYLALKILWTDGGVKEAFLRRNEFQLDDSVYYFLNELERLNEAGYTPTAQDILYSRVATVGIIEVSFKMKNFMFRVFDVGGQRSERRKWIHCFDDVNGLVFVTALSEYDQMLMEAADTNRMHESLRLFNMIVNSEWFSNTAFVLFLNKKDLFAEKISRTSIKIAFPRYVGNQDYESCVQFIEDEFRSQQHQDSKQRIYVHHTCATDTNQVQLVIDSVMDLCIDKALSSVGMN